MLLAGDARAGTWAKALQIWHNPRLPISGKDLIEMGVPPGPEVSRRLHEVEQRWVAAGFPAARTDAILIARNVLGVK
jgi:poly(A) polymerase